MAADGDLRGGRPDGILFPSHPRGFPAVAQSLHDGDLCCCHDIAGALGALLVATALESSVDCVRQSGRVHRADGGAVRDSRRHR